MPRRDEKYGEHLANGKSFSVCGRSGRITSTGVIVKKPYRR